MSRYQKNQERKEAIDALGRGLARRAKSKCEISGAAGVSLLPYEVPPIPDEPSVETTILICADVANLLADFEKRGALKRSCAGAKDLRYLETAIWSDVTAVKVVACRLLAALDIKDETWPRETLDMVYLTEAEQAWVDGG